MEMQHAVAQLFQRKKPDVNPFFYANACLNSKSHMHYFPPKDSGIYHDSAMISRWQVSSGVQWHPVASAKDAKADVKLGRNDGGTALMFAAQEGHLEVAKQLGLDQMDPRISLTL